MTSASPIALIENAIVECLRAAPRAYTGLTVTSYAGQLDDELYSWIRTMPAAWVTFSGAPEYKRISLRSMKVRATFEVLCAQRALDENAGRLNDSTNGADVGIYKILEDNKLALVNQQLGLKIHPITPGPIRAVVKNMVNREAVVVYGQEFSTEWTESFEQEAAVPGGELQTIGMDFYLKPQHTAPGDPADKSDLITLT